MVPQTTPSASPRLGEIKTSSEGMLGLKTMPRRLVSAPPRKRPSGIMPTVRSVPFGAV